MLSFSENRQRSQGLSLTSNPRTVLSSVGLQEATLAETIAGTVQNRYISPLRLQGRLTADYATEVEAKAGSSAVKIISPLTLRSATRWRLPSDTTFYVRTSGASNPGSDSNTGLGNDASGAWLTPQYAMDWIRDYVDQNWKQIVIQIADATITTPLVLYPVFGGNPAGYATSQLVLRGNTTSLGNVLVSVTSDNAISAVNVTQGWRVEGFELRTITSGQCVLADFGSNIYLGKNKFGVCAGIHIESLFDSKIELVDDYTISGNAAVHWYANAGAQVLAVSGKTVTLTGTPAFSAAFAASFDNSVMSISGLTFSGSATGVRYLATTGGGIQTGGGGANYIPGNSVGTATAPGWYA